MSCKLQKFKLLSGNEIPAIGFGTFQIRGKQKITEVLELALTSGYRLIDTAAVYGNEQHIGSALKTLLPKYKLKREDIFITSKLSPSDQGPNALAALKTSIENLQCDYLDLYLIHWPGVSGIQAESSDNFKLRNQSWASLVKGVHQGLVKDIGVSNYTVKHLKELFENSYGIKPAVNQVEWHPHYQTKELKKLCDREGIVLQAYSSLGGSNNTQLLAEPIIKSVSLKLNKSPAQILLRWALQQNIAIIPKASNAERIKENINLDFEIPAADMSAILDLNKKRKYAWDPEIIY
ncbi:uncharacterized protein LOC108734282 [Agrilus planipennis]|uniref:Uncharacterized protein LOC108734282 n=1 Tax=Agrilus planipennis TaxID=224129 RepID=A0A1W4WMC6_AGRPL|nr:uncharacterized protein LOC108734282 [Agrilus planipennis]